MQAIVTQSMINGALTAPPSKSAAHRAVLCAALAEGASHIGHIAYSADVRVTLDAVRQLGAVVEEEPAAVTVTGIGGRGFSAVDRPVYCNESGSTLRFLIPVFSLTGQTVRFTGAPRLFQRPQQVYRAIFQEQELPFAQDATGIAISGALRPGHYGLPGDVSSQFVSGLLLATPFMPGESLIRVEPPFESRSYVTMTLDMLRRFGIQADETSLADGGAVYRVPGGQRAAARDLSVEGDYSQAAFPAVLGALLGNVLIRGLDKNSRQGDKVIFDILERCGAKFTAQSGVAVFGLPAPLRAATIDLADCPDLGPILMVLGCFCRGETRILNAGRLRLKESDRIAAMEWELRKLGADITSDENTVTIRGVPLRQPETALSGNNDHRVVMSLTVAALGAGVRAEITGAEAVNKSWPTFFEELGALGARVVLRDE